MSKGAMIARLIVGGSILPRSSRHDPARVGAADTDRGYMEFLALPDEESDDAVAENVPGCHQCP